MKRLTQVVILLLVTAFLPVLVLFSFAAGAGHASALKPKPTPTPSPTLTPSPTPSSTGAWTLTGSLNAARAECTATLLSNGQVLVAGGRDNFNTPLASAELYNPSTGKWTLTGSLNVARYEHTATLLQNGEVLVAAGYTQDKATYSQVPLASAELYNPSSGTWTLTGSLNTARAEPTEALLQNGEVLVAAGYNQNSSPPFLASAELYNPSTGKWKTTGSLHDARLYNTMTLLQNGEVLVTGGYNVVSSTINILASAELYNPSTGTWTLANSMTTARTGHTATLLTNGRVLVAAGESSTSFLSSAELYNPSTGTWTLTGSLNNVRFSHTDTLLQNGEVLVAAGENPVSGYLASAELYNPSTGTWTLTGSLHVARYEHTMTLLQNGNVLVAGGVDNTSNVLASAELYAP